MPINISITAADVAEVRHALRQLLGDDQPVALEKPAPEADGGVNEVPAGERLLDAAREMRTSLVPEARAPAAPKRGRPPRQARKPVQEEPEAEAEVEQEVADEPEPVGLEQARETVRDALNGYVKMYGMDATQIDILKLYSLIFKDDSVTKVSDIPEGMHAKVVDGIKEMASKNPFKRKPV